MGKSSLICFLILVMSIHMSIANTSMKKQRKPCKKLVVYFHDILYNGHNAANATAFIVGVPEGSNRTTFNEKNFRFGNVIVFNDPVTLDNNLHSPSIGSAQGMYIYDSKSAYVAMLSFSFVFNSTSSHGTINFIGADPLTQKTRDISVVGGTGDFFMHRGIATLTTDAAENPTYFRLQVDVKFYECW